MYSYLKGIVSEKNIDNSSFVLELSGIGYQIFCNVKLLGSISLNDSLQTFISCQFREDSQKLYGFKDKASRDIFDILNSVSGVGPKAALSILNLFELDELVSAVLSDKPKLIAEAQGIGPKTAKRIILELHNKLNKFNKQTRSSESTGNEEVRLILVNLSYSEKDIDAALESAAKENISEDTELLVKYCLKYLSKQMIAG